VCVWGGGGGGHDLDVQLSHLGYAMCEALAWRMLSCARMRARTHLHNVEHATVKRSCFAIGTGEKTLAKVWPFKRNRSNHFATVVHVGVVSKRPTQPQLVACIAREVVSRVAERKNELGDGWDDVG
jgi:hypothetical protein